MEEKKIITLEEQVGVDCEVVNLKYEYPGYTGEERYGIITELTEKELKEKYGELLEQYEPFILLPLGMSKVRRDYKRNEDKFYKRSVRAGRRYRLAGKDRGGACVAQKETGKACPPVLFRRLHRAANSEDGKPLVPDCLQVNHPRSEKN